MKPDWRVFTHDVPVYTGKECDNFARRGMWIGMILGSILTSIFWVLFLWGH